MNWYINAAGTQVLGSGAATDADEDIAWALVMADRQRGGKGSLSTSYLELAKAQIDSIGRTEVDHNQSDMLLPSDAWGSNPRFNPSYFAPNQCWWAARRSEPCTTRNIGPLSTTPARVWQRGRCSLAAAITT